MNHAKLWTFLIFITTLFYINFTFYYYYFIFTYPGAFNYIRIPYITSIYLSLPLIVPSLLSLSFFHPVPSRPATFPYSTHFLLTTSAQQIISFSLSHHWHFLSSPFPETIHSFLVATSEPHNHLHLISSHLYLSSTY